MIWIMRRKSPYTRPMDNPLTSSPNPANPPLGWRIDNELNLVSLHGPTLLFDSSSIGQSLAELFADQDDQFTPLAAHRLALKGETICYEQSLGKRCYLVTIEPRYDAIGQCNGAQATAIEITYYKQAKADITKLKQQNESILQAAGEGIYGLGVDGNCTFVNRAAAEMTGWSAEETIGTSIHYKHHHTHADGSHYPHTDCPIYKAVHDGEIHHKDDEVFWRKDGSSFPVEYTSTPIYEDGKLAGAVVVFKDISERKRAEQKLMEAFHQVEHLKEQLQAENSYLREEIRQDLYSDEIIGHYPAIKKLQQTIQQVANTDATVLVCGDSGTGKELIARAIHQQSRRNHTPLVKVNCGAISAGLVESELFGHEKGAFTGAMERRQGRFELADGGTLFLDEVGELPAETQVKLLRVLQEQEFERVGSSTPLKVDVRIIAATNRNLHNMVAEGQFREDLFYRLSVFPIQAPALKARLADLPLLAQYFIEQSAQKLGKTLHGISPEGLERLQGYHWPGNIRELKNIIERATIIENGPYLNLSEFNPTPPSLGSSHLPTLEELEREHIKRVLRLTHGTIAGENGAAVILGIHPNTLRSRMQKLGVARFE